MADYKHEPWDTTPGPESHRGFTVNQVAHYDGIVLIEFDGGNIMGILMRPAPGAAKRFEYRIRLYVDDKIFDSDDEKLWSVVTSDDERLMTRESVMTKIVKTFEDVFPQDCHHKTTWIPVDGGQDELVEAMKSNPAFHVKVLDKEGKPTN